MSFWHVLYNATDDITWFLIALLIFGKGFYDKWLKHLERKMEIRMMSGAPVDTSAENVKRLQQEIERLRDTTTQYDVSIDHTLQDLKSRVTWLESRAAAIRESRPTTDEPLQVMNGRTGE